MASILTRRAGRRDLHNGAKGAVLAREVRGERHVRTELDRGDRSDARSVHDQAGVHEPGRKVDGPRLLQGILHSGRGLRAAHLYDAAEAPDARLLPKAELLAIRGHGDTVDRRGRPFSGRDALLSAVPRAEMAIFL